MPISSGGGYPRATYIDDAGLFNTSFLRFWFGVMVVLVLVCPLFASNYMLHLINLALLACLGALALNIVTGYAGLISLGTGGFLCAGAFTTAILISQFQVPFWANIVGAAIVGGVLGFIAGLPALRLKGVYLLLSTLAMHFIIVYTCAFYQIRGGYIGGITLPDPVILSGVTLDSSFKWYFFLVAVLGVITIFCINLERTHIGRAWIALREKDVAARILGVNLGYYKLLAFVFSSALIGIAGSLFAYYTHFTAYEEYSIWVSIFYLGMIIIGGVASITGSFLGAFLVTLLPHFLHWFFGLFSLPMSIDIYFSAVELSVFGIILILFLLLEPRGLMGIWKLKIRPYFELWPYKYRKAISTRR